MREYMQVPIAGLPINLLLFADEASIAFVITRRFKGVYDLGSDSVDAYMDMEGFAIGTESYNYNTEYKYKEIPDMLKWLQQQRLILQ